MDISSAKKWERFVNCETSISNFWQAFIVKSHFSSLAVRETVPQKDENGKVLRIQFSSRTTNTANQYYAGSGRKHKGRIVVEEILLQLTAKRPTILTEYQVQRSPFE